MIFKQLNDDWIKEFSGSTIFQRGRNYYQTNAVEKFEYDSEENSIEAVVSGQYGNYQVEISEDKNEIDAYCDCPYDGYPCKHIVAVLLYFIHEAKNYQTAQKDKETELNNLKKSLLQYPQDKLVETLLKCVKKYPDLRRDLLLQVEPENEITLLTILKQIDKIKLLCDYDNYHNHNNSPAKELNKILKSLKNASRNIQSGIYWKIADKVLEFLDEYGVDDELTEQIAIDALDGFAESLTKSDGELKKIVINSLINYYLTGNTGLNDFCFEMAEQLCSSKKEYLALADKLNKSSNSFYQKQAASLYKKAGNIQAQLEALSKTLVYGMDYWCLAQYWLEQQDFTQALTIVEQGIAKGEGRKDELYDFLTDYYQQQENYLALFELLEKIVAAEKKRGDNLLNNKVYKILANYYQAKKDYPSLKQLIFLLLQIPLNFNLEIYQYAEKLLNEADFKEFSQQIIHYLSEQKTGYLDGSVSNESKVLARIYAYQQNLTALHSLCNKHVLLLKDHQFVLATHFSETYIENYKREIKRLIDGRGRESYQIAADYLKRLKNIYQENNLDLKQWQVYLDNLREENKRLPALREELKRAGL